MEGKSRLGDTPRGRVHKVSFVVGISERLSDSCRHVFLREGFVVTVTRTHGALLKRARPHEGCFLGPSRQLGVPKIFETSSTTFFASRAAGGPSSKCQKGVGERYAA